LFFVCGESDPAYLEQSRWLVAESGNSGDVVFIKEWLSEQDLATLIKMSTVSVNIPLADGLPASLLEIMASDSIPIAGDLPAYREFYKENVNGLILHSLTDSNELQGLLEYALTDTEQLIRKFSKRNNEYIEEYHNWKVQSEKLMELYSMR
jgi:glycosyltransferase involved in cell wall biosynthesis